MARPRCALLVAVTFTVLLATVACGSDSDTRDGVDTSTLDTGDYPTRAFDPGRADDTTIITYEAQRLADYVLPPWQIDPILRERSDPTMPIRSTSELGWTIGRNVTSAPENDYVLYGFASSAAEPRAPGDPEGRSLVQVVLRYVDPGSAAAAAAAIHQKYQEASNSAGRYVPTSLPGKPDVFALRGRQRDGNQTLVVFTPINDTIVYSYLTFPPTESEWANRTAGSAIDRQSELIASYRGRPTKQQRGGKTIGYPERDPHKVLRYTIPVDKETVEKPKNGSANGVYGLRGLTHFESDPAQRYEALDQAGVKYQARAKTRVYRAASDDQARTLVDRLTRQMTTGQGFVPGESPPGLSTARCVRSDTSDGRRHQCFVRVGRYVGEVAGLDDQKDVWQRTSAQYMILQEADQKAE